MQLGKFTGIVLSAAVVATPALAQTASHPTTSAHLDTNGTGSGTIGTTTPGSTTGTPGMAGTAGMGSAGPATMGAAASSDSAAASNRNPVLTDSGNVRASKVIGSTVYNDKDQKIGTVDDIILGSNDMPAKAVLSVGGFLGLDAKLVAVPYDKLQFGDTSKNSDNRVMMPGATKDSLTSMQTYSYAAK